MNAVVLDASVLIKLFIEERGSVEAVTAVESAGQLLAPDLLLADSSNILWKRVRRGDLEATAADELLTDILQMPIQYTPSRDLVEVALRFAIETKRTVYDALYLALAIQADAVLITTDECLANSLASAPYAARVQLIP